MNIDIKRKSFKEAFMKLRFQVMDIILSVFLLLFADLPFLQAEEVDSSGFLIKIDQAYAERDHEEVLKKGELLCEEALEKGIPKDEIYWRMARFKAWEGNLLTKKDSEKLKRFQEAEAWANKGIVANPGNVEAHFWLGVAYGRIGETQGIFKSFSLIEPIRHEMNEVLILNPNHAGAHHLLGVMYRKLPWFKGGSNKKSAEELQKSIELNRRNTLYHLDLAKTYFAMNKSADAKRELETVKTMADPFDPVQSARDKKEADLMDHP